MDFRQVRKELRALVVAERIIREKTIRVIHPPDQVVITVSLLSISAAYLYIKAK